MRGEVIISGILLELRPEAYTICLMTGKVIKQKQENAYETFPASYENLEIRSSIF